MRQKKQRPSWVYFLIGMFALVTLFRIGKRFYDYESSKLSPKELAAIEQQQEKRTRQNRLRSYAQELDYEKLGISLLSFTNDPYPLFYVSTLEPELREEALIYILETLIQDKKVEKEIDLGGDWYTKVSSAPAEVKLVLGVDYDAVVMEKLFTLKKNRYGGYSVDENSTK